MRRRLRRTSGRPLAPFVGPAQPSDVDVAALRERITARPERNATERFGDLVFDASRGGFGHFGPPLEFQMELFNEAVVVHAIPESVVEHAFRGGHYPGFFEEFLAACASTVDPSEAGVRSFLPDWATVPVAFHAPESGSLAFRAISDGSKRPGSVAW